MVMNRAQKNLSSVGSWENSRKATIEADLKKMEVLILVILWLTSESQSGSV